MKFPPCNEQRTGGRGIFIFRRYVNWELRIAIRQIQARLTVKMISLWDTWHFKNCPSFFFQNFRKEPRVAKLIHTRKSTVSHLVHTTHTHTQFICIHITISISIYLYGSLYTYINKCWQWCGETGTFIHSWYWYKWYSHCGKHFGSSSELNTEWPYNLVIYS